MAMRLTHRFSDLSVRRTVMEAAVFLEVKGDDVWDKISSTIQPGALASAVCLSQVLAGYDKGLDPRQPANLTVPEYSKMVSPGGAFEQMRTSDGGEG
jgi:hypothetical protein